MSTITEETWAGDQAELSQISATVVSLGWVFVYIFGFNLAFAALEELWNGFVQLWILTEGLERDLERERERSVPRFLISWPLLILQYTWWGLNKVRNDFLLRNDEFLLKYDDFLLKNVEFVIHNARRWKVCIRWSSGCV